MQLKDYDTSQRHDAVVQSTVPITPPGAEQEIRELVLDVQAELPLEAGQSIGVLAPGDPEFGQREHLRLYTVADLPEAGGNGTSRLKIAVKRVDYIDEYSGERYAGRASNYLCDLREGDRIRVVGPFGSPFPLPDESDANIILIGMGTGISPFRAYVKRLYAARPDFAGAVRLFHGARSGLELAYMNDERDDFAQYYDRETFVAIKALSPRPHWNDPIDWEAAVEARSEEIWEMLLDHKTYVFLAGLERIRDQLDAVFAKVAPSPDKWHRRKAELAAGGRWIELLY